VTLYVGAMAEHDVTAFRSLENTSENSQIESKCTSCATASRECTNAFSRYSRCRRRYQQLAIADYSAATADAPSSGVACGGTRPLLFFKYAESAGLCSLNYFDVLNQKTRIPVSRSRSHRVKLRTHWENLRNVLQQLV
jgi:hypothetical protein